MELKTAAVFYPMHYSKGTKVDDAVCACLLLALLLWMCANR